MAQRLPWVAVLAGATAVACALSPIQDLPSRDSGDGDLSGEGGKGGHLPGPGGDDGGLVGDPGAGGSGDQASGGDIATGGQEARAGLLGGGGAGPAP